jgi:hypothetical protein
MNKTIEVWKVMWPDGIAVEDYERAILMAQLAKDPGQPKQKRKYTKRAIAVKPKQKRKLSPEGLAKLRESMAHAREVRMAKMKARQVA